MNTKAKIGLICFLAIGIVLIDYFMTGFPALLLTLLYGGALLMVLTIYIIKRTKSSISYFVIAFLVIGGLWGLMGEEIKSYYSSARINKFCQENVEIGNPCGCPVASWGAVKNPCDTMPIGKGVFYKIISHEPPRPPLPSGEPSPPHDPYKRFLSTPTILGKLTYLPLAITYAIMGSPPHDIFFLIWLWLYPIMLIGMIIFGLFAYVYEKFRGKKMK